MQLLHDFLLVKEIAMNDTIEGTNLHIKYDDNEKYMYVEVIQSSIELKQEVMKYYPSLTRQEADLIVQAYKPGSKLIAARIAKTPYKDGLYFISFKDIVATLDDVLLKSDKVVNDLIVG